jgi:DNA polymerase-3 subunit alpha
MQERKLKEYCIEKSLDHEIDEGVLVFQDKEYFIVPGDVHIFNADFKFIPISPFAVDGYVYQFGGRWYLQEEGESVTMTEFKYMGQAVQKLPNPAFLGVHSGNELLNGLGLYKNWVQKAQFLGVKALGICEKNTLSGVIEFQLKCKAAGIKPIIGMEIELKSESGNPIGIKIYARNYQGWQNLLKMWWRSIPRLIPC